VCYKETERMEVENKENGDEAMKINIQGGNKMKNKETKG
jgi:hypothetical protein